MKERPILFQDQLVRAILDGKKTETRRLAGLDNINAMPGLFTEPPRLVIEGTELYADFSVDDDGIPRVTRVRCPYGKAGDVLYVRESWRPRGCADYLVPDNPDVMVYYRADDSGRLVDGEKIPEDWVLPKAAKPGKWVPSIHMPRWAARILADVVEIRVERLHDIKDAGALAEGVDRTNTSIPGYARQRFEKLWDQVNGAGAWAENPWLWVVAFKPKEPSRG